MIIIAEIGTAHNGSLDKAFSLIDAAKEAGANAVKFQWVYADEILHPDTGFVNLPGGKVRLYDRFKELEEESEFYAKTLEYAHKQGLLYICSPFGLKSLKELVQLKPDAIKIASPETNHFTLLQETANYYGKIPIILSSGVSKLGDIEKAINILTSKNECENKDILVTNNTKLPALTLLHCVTFYPAPEEEYNVRCVDTLNRVFGVPTGISDHSLDPVLIPVLSVAMGAVMIEKHITLSRKTDGLDDPVALEGEQFAQMVYAVNQTKAVLNRWQKESFATGMQTKNIIVSGQDFICTPSQAEVFRQMANQYGEQKVLLALGTGVKKLAPSELKNYGRTNRSLHYTKSLCKGKRLNADDIAILRTEKILSPGIFPEYLKIIENCILQKDVVSGSGVQLEDFFVK